MDVRRRGYQAADAPALAELMNAIEQHAGGHPGHTADELHGLICTLVRDPAADSSMLFGPDGALVAAGFTTTPPDGGFRVYLTGGVHPRWRGRGIGRELLARHFARAVEIHRAQAPDVPWEAQVLRTPTGDEDAIRLFRRFGMTPVRYWFEMVAFTASAPAVVPPFGLRLATYSAGHEEAVHATHMEAFAENWGFQRRDLPGWADLTVRAKDFLPELSLVAFHGDELVGYVLTYDHADPAMVYVGQLGVRRAWRRRGLAGALLASVIGGAARAGRTTVALSVDADSPTGAVGVYQRAGFTVEFSTVTHSIPLGD